jgi:putative ABC transport system permease protein
MNTEDRIWNLVIKKLTHEASEKELRELSALLKENPDFNNSVRFMLEWWEPGTVQEPEDYSYILFKKILARIKEAEANMQATNPYKETERGYFEPGLKKKR